MAPAMGKLPMLSSLLKWFKGDELVIDNALFKLHHQASTFILMFGLLFIFLENHLDGRAIVCQGGDQYARSFCWIHGTAYIREHLQVCLNIDNGHPLTCAIFHAWAHSAHIDSFKVPQARMDPKI
jgi:hypothetical protein